MNRFLLIILLFPLFCFAQNSIITSYSKQEYSNLVTGIQEENEITIHIPNKGDVTYNLAPAGILPEALQAKYPDIKAYRGTSDDGLHIRLDINPKGISGWVVEDNLFFKINAKKQLVFFDDVAFEAFEEREPRHREILSQPLKARRLAKPVAGTLRVYRTAIACTGEYAQFHGGTKALALAAIASSINRVNEIFERDLGIRLALITSNDDVIFLNAATDPFTNDQPDQLIAESQQTIDDIIGEQNYDVGHTFSTEGGGLADWASICGPFKAGGITGTVNPIGDPFDIDYVCHEIGHQLGADHTFNTNVDDCDAARVDRNAYEIGSGSTIMSYAGLCAPHNIQDFSSPYFHSKSIEQIQNYLGARGGTCGSTINNNNTAPVITPGQTTFSIPANTPFKLEASASDMEDDDLTYCWEQIDLGSGGAPLAPSGSDPLFRSFDPVAEGHRYFPQLGNLLSNTATLGEYLPDYQRELNFRVLVRDNHPGGGGTNYQDYTIDVIDNGATFEITSQTDGKPYASNDHIDITWNTANTENSPFFTEKVEILLSLDGGQTFDIELGTVDNNGAAQLQLPTSTSDNARIMVRAVGNVFFNINSAAFQINPPAYPDFGVDIITLKDKACQNETVSFKISTVSYNGFSAPINFTIPGLAKDINVSYSVNPITPGDTSIVTLSSDKLSGNFNYTLMGSSDTLTHDSPIAFQLNNTTLEAPNLLLPAQDEINSPITPIFTWEKNTQADYYTLNLADNPTMTNSEISALISTSQKKLDSQLEPTTTYYWQVTAHNDCSTSDLSAISSFTTGDLECATFESSDTPLTLANGTSDFYSVIDVSSPGNVTSISIPNIKGLHQWTSDLYFSLVSPQGSEIDLFGYICDGTFSENFDVGFDDQSSNGLTPCPPTGGGIYQPNEPLNTFDGEAAQGEWRLHIYDEFPALDQGLLTEWSIEVCSENVINGIDQTEIKHFAYPNPANSTLYISNTKSPINIYNAMGQLEFTSESNEVDIEHLPAGIYFFGFSQQKVEGKFIKL